MAKADFLFLVLYLLSEGLILVFGRMVRLLISYFLSIVRMFISAGRGAVGSADIHFAKGRFGVDVLILCPIFIFTGRGARMRGNNPKRTGGRFASSHSPYPL